MRKQRRYTLYIYIKMRNRVFFFFFFALPHTVFTRCENCCFRPYCFFFCSCSSRPGATAAPPLCWVCKRLARCAVYLPRRVCLRVRVGTRTCVCLCAALFERAHHHHCFLSCIYIYIIYIFIYSTGGGHTCDQYRGDSARPSNVSNQSASGCGSAQVTRKRHVLYKA